MTYDIRKLFQPGDKLVLNNHHIEDVIYDRYMSNEDGEFDYIYWAKGMNEWNGKTVTLKEWGSLKSAFKIVETDDWHFDFCFVNIPASLELKNQTTMNIEVGDYVIIRSDLEVGEMYGDNSFVDDMKKHLGKKCKVTSADRRWDIKIEGSCYHWTPEMISSVIKNQTTMNTQTITRENYKKIYDVACGTWKSKLKEWATPYVLDSEITLTNKQVNEMFEAADSDQKLILSQFLKRDDGLVHYDDLQMGECMRVNFCGSPFTIMKTYSAAVCLEDPLLTWAPRWNGKGKKVKVEWKIID